MAIDWDATGSMLQGWATLAGAAAVVYAAWKGGSTFDLWRRQKQEEKRMDAAERIMTLAYMLRYDLQSIRAHFITGHELATAKQELEEAGEWAGLREELRDKTKTAQAIYGRLRRHKEDFQMIWELKPLALAFFGRDVEAALHVFWTQYVAISISAESFAADDGSDRELSISIRRDLWPKSDSDTVKALDAAVSSLEAELLPILRNAAHSRP